MFKFVVLCAFVAVAIAEPEPSSLIAPYAPLAYTSSFIAPATTTITKTASSVVHPPYYYPGYAAYSSPYYPHFIKKRSAPLAYASSYITPSTYYTSAPLIAPAYSTYSAPLLHSAPYISAHLPYAAPAHFIKKRSASLLPSTYIAPTTTYYSPYYPSYYPSLYSSYYPSYYPSHYPYYPIKK
ncbi:uncharacterized protein LOC113227206 [Hyposmocoma kahamanoa]|uniref:uncharacterized protein LOC113227206 n=1 Tax=Hyposmocoma kahamanoa TaxID=1477025 RepID=UPI000E6D8FF8|nr:uncharacterized protein LOC113227206 [Hyposmocoma kahamanoa]